MASIVRRRLMTVLVMVLVALVSVFLLLGVLASAFQERIAFQPPRGPYPNPGGIRRVSYTADDGQALFAYVIGEPTRSQGALIVFHGNADIAVRSVDWAEELVRRTGLSIVLPEYRGYMGLEGRPSYEGVRRDSRAVYHYAIDSLGVDRERLAFYGHSLGSAVAAELAVGHPPRVLILESPFTSARDMTASMIGSWFTATLWRFISRVHFDTARIVASLDVPVSVAHGGQDLIVPSRMGETVYRRARRKGEWFFVPRAGHNDLRITGSDGYWEWLTRSLEPLTLAKGK